MRDFYEQFYSAIETSAAYAEFCIRVYGRDLGQHGFADMAQLDALIAAAELAAGQRALDVGCGDGRIAENISDTTGAHLTGIDYSPAAIAHAQARTRAKADRLAFVVGDINAPDLPDAAYDAIISIDSLYFSDDYAATLRAWSRALLPGGRMVIFYGFGHEPWVPLDEFPAHKLPPDNTPLAEALHAVGLPYVAQEFTADDLRLAETRQRVLAELRPRFEAEGTLFLYENRIGEANGMAAAMRAGLHRRYLYIVSCP